MALKTKLTTKPTKPKLKSGRPTKYDPDFHPANFLAQSKQGRNLTQISCGWNMSRDTLYEWAKHHPIFSDALKDGREYCEAWYTNLGMAAMVGQATIDGKKVDFNLGAFVWMTKNVLKWSDKTEQKTEVSGSLMTGRDRETAMKGLFKNDKARDLALQLAEELDAESDDPTHTK